MKEAGVGVGPPGFEVEGLAFSDNLSAHKYKTNTKTTTKTKTKTNIRTEAHLRKLRQHHVLPWFTPEGLTDETQVVDSHNGPIVFLESTFV